MNRGGSVHRSPFTVHLIAGVLTSVAMRSTLPACQMRREDPMPGGWGAPDLPPAGAPWLGGMAGLAAGRAGLGWVVWLPGLVALRIACRLFVPGGPGGTGGKLQALDFVGFFYPRSAAVSPRLADLPGGTQSRQVQGRCRVGLPGAYHGAKCWLSRGFCSAKRLFPAAPPGRVRRLPPGRLGWLGGLGRASNQMSSSNSPGLMR
jgi:hypothetical protein